MSSIAVIFTVFCDSFSRSSCNAANCWKRKASGARRTFYFVSLSLSFSRKSSTGFTYEYLRMPVETHDFFLNRNRSSYCNNFSNIIARLSSIPRGTYTRQYLPILLRPLRQMYWYSWSIYALWLKWFEFESFSDNTLITCVSTEIRRYTKI